MHPPWALEIIVKNGALVLLPSYSSIPTITMFGTFKTYSIDGSVNYALMRRPSRSKVNDPPRGIIDNITRRICYASITNHPVSVLPTSIVLPGATCRFEVGKNKKARKLTEEIAAMHVKNQGL